MLQRANVYYNTRFSLHTENILYGLSLASISKFHYSLHACYKQKLLHDLSPLLMNASINKMKYAILSKTDRSVQRTLEVNTCHLILTEINHFYAI